MTRRPSAYERLLGHEARIELGEPPPVAVVMADVEEAVRDLYHELAAELDSGHVDRHSPEGRALARMVTSLASAIEQLELTEAEDTEEEA
jgi:hypothetical protein